MSDLLRARLPRFAPPPGLESRIRIDLDAARQAARARSPRIGLWVLSGAMAAAVALLAGYEGGVRRAETAEFGRELVSDEVRAQQSEHMIDVVSSDRHTVKPWLARRLDFSPPVTDPSPESYPLVGGRLDRVGSATAAALIYQRSRHWVTVYVWPADTAPPMAQASVLGYSIRAWRSGDLNFAAVSDIPAADLGGFVAQLRAAN